MNIVDAAAIIDSPKVEIEVRTTEGLRKVRAWRHGALAVHQMVLQNGLIDLEYSITHVPSGIAMGPTFEDARSAIAAMIEISGVCQWETFEPKQVTISFRKRMREIFKRHDALPDMSPDREIRRVRAQREFARDLNGYRGDE